MALSNQRQINVNIIGKKKKHLLKEKEIIKYPN